jgi:hypothetical protein
MDLDRDRHFDGSISQLSMYNRALAGDEVHSMYESVRRHFLVEVETAARGEQIVSRGSDSTCSLTEGRTQECNIGEICVDINSQATFLPSQSTGTSTNASEATGVCLPVPSGLELLMAQREAFPGGDAAPAAVPVPYAWFSMNGTLESWPVPRCS